MRAPQSTSTIPPCVGETRCGERDLKPRPVAYAFARCGDHATVSLDECLDDGEPDASSPVLAVSCRVCAIEPLEEMRNVFGGDPFTLVRDGDRHPAPLVMRLRRHCHETARHGVADGVVEHIAEHLRQSLGITDDSERLLGHALPDLHPRGSRPVGR